MWEINDGLKFIMCIENWWLYFVYGSKEKNYFFIKEIYIFYELGIVFIEYFIFFFS